VRGEAPLSAAGCIQGQNVYAPDPQTGSGGGSMGEMKRANAYEEERRLKDRFASTLVIAASIIAAVRLARDENISRSSSRLTTVIADSVGLARMILEKVMR
jgi:hypothetical protein